MKILMMPTGNAGPKRDFFTITFVYVYLSIVTVSVGYLAQIPLKTCLGIALLSGSIIGGYSMSHGSDATAPIRGLLWMVFGPCASFIIIWLYQN
mgnify:CR=1 FL=1